MPGNIVQNDILRRIVKKCILSNSISLNTTTSTKILDDNYSRKGFIVSNDSAVKIWLKMQAASMDNDKKGIIISPNTHYKDIIYTGEVCAIADVNNPALFVLEY